jgi:hypothetical protein
MFSRDVLVIPILVILGPALRSERGKPMGTFWSYFLDFFGLAGLARVAAGPLASALVSEARGEGEGPGR